MKRCGIIVCRGVVVAGMVLVLGGVNLQASIVGFLSSPDANGLIAGADGWISGSGGYRVDWTIDQNMTDLTWHYKYELSNENGGTLDKLTSHFMISLSDDIEESDLYNYSVDCNLSEIEFGTFEPGVGNPGFPDNNSIFGVKIGLYNSQAVVEFDSNRQPMWGDFYAKDGKTGPNWNYAYNTHLGVTVANQHNYMETPVDAFDNELHKILVPNMIPEPATIAILGLGALALLRRYRT